MADFNRRIAGLDVIKRVCRSQGLEVPSIAAGNPEVTIQTMWGLLTEVGQDLMNGNEWQVLAKEHTFVTDGGGEYSLPTDFSGFYNGSTWNVTNRTPAVGSTPVPIWRALKVRVGGSGLVGILYRISNDKLLILDDVAGNTITFAYKSRGWVQDESTSTVYRDYVENDGDVILFEPRLIISALRLRWLEKNGFDTLAATREYSSALSDALGRDVSGMVLSTVPVQRYPYLSQVNIPETGYGS